MKRRSGWSLAEAVTGILLIALGVLTWCYPGNMLAWITVLYGVLAVWMGVGDILLFIRWERYTGFAPILSLISGILSVMCGIMLIVYPDTGRWALSALVPVWFMAHCIAQLCRLDVIRLWRGRSYSIFALVVNSFGLAMGVLMLDPVVSSWTLQLLGYMAAVYLILLGIESLVMAFGDR